MKDANGKRLVAGCVPVKLTADEPTQLLLVSSRKHPDAWILPKGGIERHESAADAAIRETYEEAGVRGSLLNNGSMVHEAENSNSHFIFYVLKVTDELDQWPEDHERVRKWFALDEALNQCQRPAMQQAIQAAHQILKFEVEKL